MTQFIHEDKEHALTYGELRQLAYECSEVQDFIEDRLRDKEVFKTARPRNKPVIIVWFPSEDEANREWPTVITNLGRVDGKWGWNIHLGGLPELPTEFPTEQWFGWHLHADDTIAEEILSRYGE